MESSLSYGLMDIGVFRRTVFLYRHLYFGDRARLFNWTEYCTRDVSDGIIEHSVCTERAVAKSMEEKARDAE